jgi:polar amino acid transport system substrate-binding protein
MSLFKALAFSLLALPALAAEPDLSPEQPGRILTEKVQAAIDLLPKDCAFVTPGKLTVATTTWQLPFGVYATDNKTPVGAEPDIAGLKVIVGSGTHQEQILLNWIAENKATGLAPTDLLYFDDEAARDLVLFSGRADAYFGPNAAPAYKNALKDDRKLLGTFSGGYPQTADIAVVTRKGSGLNAAVTAALNGQIEAGVYGKVLARWGISSEAVTQSRTNPLGLPKS